MAYRSAKTVNVAPWIEHFKQQAAGTNLSHTQKTTYGRSGSRLVVVGTSKTEKANDQLPIEVVEPIQQETQQARAELVQDIKDSSQKKTHTVTSDRKAKSQASKVTKRTRDILSN